MSVIKILFTSGSDTDVEVVSLSYSLNQNIDNIGQPAGEVKGGTITVSLGSIGSADRYGWMVASDMKKDGEIKFIDRNKQTLKTLKFTDAYCVAYTEEYEGFSDNEGAGGVSIKASAKETLTLSCREIDMEGEVHENSWTAA